MAGEIGHSFFKSRLFVEVEVVGIGVGSAIKTASAAHWIMTRALGEEAWIESMAGEIG
jgi:hypothetical protein